MGGSVIIGFGNGKNASVKMPESNSGPSGFLVSEALVGK
jgi:hypothetical protein